MEDASQFDAFYETTRRGLWAFLFRVSGDGALAEDLAQEAYVRLLTSRAMAFPEAERKAFLYRIALNLVKDSWRRFQRADDYAKEVSAEAAGDLAAATSRAGHVAEAAVGAAFGRLSPRQRSLLWLAYVEGFSHREIATTVGIAEMSVRVLLMRARKKMADLLGEFRDSGEVSS